MAERSHASGLSPSPFSRARPAREGEFPDDEEPTRPGGQTYQFNRLATAWRMLSAEDRNWLDRVVELMAWSKKT